MARGKRAVQASAEPVEGPWALPEGWRWERLGDLGAWYGGGTPSKENATFWADGSIPWVSPKDMKTPFIDDTEDHITEVAVAASSTKLIPEGSVLIVTRSGILRHSLPVAVTRRTVTLNQDMRAVHPRSDVLPGFLANFLRGSAQDILHACVKDGTTVNSIETDRLMSWRVPIAPLEVQRAVLKRLDQLFAEIDDGEAALADARAGVETYRKALLKAAVTGELTADWRRENPPTETGQDLLRRILADRRARWEADPKNRKRHFVEPNAPETDELPHLPDEWRWVTVGSLGSVSGGLTQNSKRHALPRKLPFLRVANVYAGRLDLSVIETIGVAEGELDRSLLEKGDLLIVEGNGSIDQIGRAALWDGSIDPCAHQNHLIKVRFGDPRLGRWVQAWLQAPHGRRELEQCASSTSGLHTLSISKVSALRCPLPPSDEFDVVLERLNDHRVSLLDASRALEQARKSPSEVRQSILAAAFRGELV